MTKLAASLSTDLVFKVDTRDMSPAQVRLLKQIQTLLIHTLTAEEESEYFEASAQLLRQTAQLIKHSHFPEVNRAAIPYAEQAVEYAMEALGETMAVGSRGDLDN